MSRKFEYVDSIPQVELQDYYAKADVYVRTSREEGLAVVQVQALASGLPLVCTHNARGGDLVLSPELRERITVEETNNLTSLETGIDRAIEMLSGLPKITDDSRVLLSWREYGNCYRSKWLKTR